MYSVQMHEKNVGYIATLELNHPVAVGNTIDYGVRVHDSISYTRYRITEIEHAVIYRPEDLYNEPTDLVIYVEEIRE